MDITLDGLPISEDQCIGDSLSYINNAFEVLRTSIIASASSIGDAYATQSSLSNYFPKSGGIVSGGIQIGNNVSPFSGASVLKFIKTTSNGDGVADGSYPTMHCGESGSNNDLFINTNTALSKIILRTYNGTSRITGMTINGSGNVVVPTGNITIGQATASNEKLEIVGGNVKITTSSNSSLVLCNNTALGAKWSSRILFQSYNADKYEIGVDKQGNGTNEFHIYDTVASSYRFRVLSNGYVNIGGNVGIGTEPVADYRLKVNGALYVESGITLNGAFSCASLTTAGAIGGTAISGTTGTFTSTGSFTGKLTVGSFESLGAVVGTTGTYSGKLKTNSTDGIESNGPITGLAITGTTGSYSGKITTISTDGIESGGPITGKAITGTTGTFLSGGSFALGLTVNSLICVTGLSATSGTYSGKITTTSTDGIASEGPITATNGSFSGLLTAANGFYTGDRIIGNDGSFVGQVTANSMYVSNSLRANTGTFNGRISADSGTFAYDLCARNLTTTRDVACRNLTTTEGVIVTGDLSASNIFDCSGSAYFRSTMTVSGATRFNSNLTVSGNVSATGDILAHQTSDERLKKNIVVIPNALAKIADIRGCEFEWNEQKAESHLRGKSVGVIAQEVEAVFPQAVVTREDGYKAVRYEYLIPLLIEAVKDLQDEVEDLKSKLKT